MVVTYEIPFDTFRSSGLYSASRPYFAMLLRLSPCVTFYLEVEPRSKSLCDYLLFNRTIQLNSDLSTKSVLKWLFFFAMNRAFLVCATQLALAITYLASPTSLYWYVIPTPELGAISRLIHVSGCLFNLPFINSM